MRARGRQRHATSRRLRVALTLVLSITAGGALVASPAHAVTATYSGTVVDSLSAAVPNAFVSLVGTAGSYGTTAAANGTFSITAEAGVYDLAAHAPGHAATSVLAIDLTGGDLTGQTVTLTGSGTKFDSLPVFGAQVGGLRRGGAGGEFYLSTSVIPQVFRTVDHGGTWTPATVGYDDANDGLDRTMNLMRGQHMTTSGRPGEVAVFISNSVYASFDFGVTWEAVGGPITTSDDGSGVYLYWGHAGAASVLLVTAPDGGGTNWVADMEAVDPALTEMTTPYATASQPVAVAPGSDAPYVAVADPATGDVDVYELTAADSPGAAASTLSSMLPSVDALALGGASASGTSPSVLLAVDTAGDGTAVSALKGTADASFAGGDLSNSTTVNNPGGGLQCISAGGGMPVTADVPPSASGDGGSAHLLLGSCAVIAAPASDLTFDQFGGTNGLSVFDAGFDASTSEVILGTDGARGIVKSAQFDADPAGGWGPDFPTGADASPGDGAGSGGVAVNGLTVPVVKDVTLGPAAGNLAVSLSGTAGNVGIATDDGGTTMATVVEKGGLSTAWWAGSGGSTWLAFGAGGGGNLLTVRQDWAPVDAALPGPNVATGHASMAGGNVNSLAGLPGSDVVFYGTSVAGGGAVGRASLTGSGDAITATVDASASRDDPVRAIAYCPSAGSAASVADALFVGTAPEGAGGGELTRVESASSAPDFTGVATGLSAGSGINDVAVDCTTATVWVGAGSGNQGGLYKSTDGGVTFTSVNPSAAPSLNVTSIALDPTNGSEVLVAANAEGYVYRSTNGGDSWLNPNDPQVSGGRSFMSEGIRGLVLPPSGGGGLSVSMSLGGDVGAQVAAPDAVVGTGGGLLEGAVRSGTSPPVSGIYSARRTGGTWGASAKASSTSASTTLPEVVVDSNQRAHLVYVGSSGLYHRSRASSSDTWSSATKIAGTGTGDTQPSISVRGTTLYLAFRRTSGSTGVYTSVRTASWQAPERVASGALSSPAITVDRDGKRHIAWVQSTGIGYASNASGPWLRVAPVRGSTSGAASPSVVASASSPTTVWISFARSDTGIVLTKRASSGAWSSAKVPGTAAGDVTPVMTIDGRGKQHLAYRRPSGGTAGIHYSTNRTGSWSDRRVSTSTADRDPGLAATTAAAPNPPVVHLAFTRVSGSAGVYTAVTSAGVMGPASRRVAVDDARRPALGVEAGGGRTYLVFSRA